MYMSKGCLKQQLNMKLLVFYLKFIQIYRLEYEVILCSNFAWKVSLRTCTNAAVHKKQKKNNHFIYSFASVRLYLIWDESGLKVTILAALRTLRTWKLIKAKNTHIDQVASKLITPTLAYFFRVFFRSILLVFLGKRSRG